MSDAQPGDRVVRPQITIGGEFTLTDHFGRIVTERSWPGQYLLIFFGFTNCKVVCPRALAKLSEVMALLGESGRRVQPLYITVDPERDTPDRMREFLAAYPLFLGLAGSTSEIQHVKSAYRVFAERQANEDGGYEVPHSAISYLISPDGALSGHFVDALDASTIAARARVIMTARSI